MRARGAFPPRPPGPAGRIRLGLLATAALLFSASCAVTPAPPLAEGASAPAGTQAVSVESADCSAPASALPAGATRVYIALRNGVDGSGLSAADARDGSSPQAFDTILRCYSEGCTSPAVPPTENLIVCLGPGTFQTMGTYDAIVDNPHLTPIGFTLNKGWKLHGQGPDVTTLQLSGFLPITDPANPYRFPPGTGRNVVLSTASHAAYGVEISDLTVDANYPVLKQVASAGGIIALNLEAINLWSAQGHNWLHNLHVINSASEVGGLDGSLEGMVVIIQNASPGSTPTDSSGNLIENLTLSQFGGGACTAIAIANVAGEVRNNTVIGYQIGYGGWSLGSANFHDNVATGTTYGFNFDSLPNQGVRIASNTLAPAHGFGMVIGGGATYQGFTITGNTIRISDADTAGLLFQGGVSNASVTGNIFTGGPPGALAIRVFSNGPTAGPNGGNVYQSNKIDSQLKVLFQAPSSLSLDCSFGNTDEQGNLRLDLPNTSPSPCIP
jgi:hypothetical protein